MVSPGRPFFPNTYLYPFLRELFCDLLKHPVDPQSQEPGAAVDTTNKDYDLAEVTKAVRGLGIGMAIVRLRSSLDAPDMRLTFF